MRVLVLLPTTGALNRIVRLEARPDLPASGVYAQGDFRPLAITKDYDALTSKAGPLAALGPPVNPGPHRLWLAGPIDSGKSWELPVLLAHLAAALGAELAAEPAMADIVLWSTGAVDLDLNVVHHDYNLPAKADRSRAELKGAVAAGAQVIAIVPACEDASPLRDLLTEVGARRVRVDLVNSVSDVGATRRLLEQALGLTTDPAGKTGTPRQSRKIPVLLCLVAAVALGGAALAAFAIGHGGITTVAGYSVGPVAGAKGIDAEGADAAVTGVKNSSRRGDDDGNSAAPTEAAPAAPPVQITELRDPNGGACFGVLMDHIPPRRIDVPVDGKGHFRDSNGWNLCGLEWTLNPQSGARDFDVDLPAARYGFRMTRLEAPGVKKIKVEFTRPIPYTITYNVQLRFGDANFGDAPSEGRTRQFHHKIVLETVVR